jgi:hypothetical protein
VRRTRLRLDVISSSRTSLSHHNEPLSATASRKQWVFEADMIQTLIVNKVFSNTRQQRQVNISGITASIRGAKLATLR